jgi:hypothetical protein
MKAQIVNLEAIQGHYPPRLRFRVRLKNDTDNYWYIYGISGSMRTFETPSVQIGTTDVIFNHIEINAKEEADISPEIELDYRKLELLEEKRKGNLYFDLLLDLFGIYSRPIEKGFESLEKALSRGFQVERISVDSPNRRGIMVPQSTWVEVLEGLDYGKFILIELPLSPLKQGVSIDDAIKHFINAKASFMEGNWSEVLTNCRKSLDSLNSAIETSAVNLERLFNEDEIKSKYPDIKDKYLKSYKIKGIIEKTRELSHIGPHIEIIPLKSDAELALNQTGAILGYFTEYLIKISK